MTARELWQEYQELLEEKQLQRLDGINTRSTKAEIQNGIDCLRCSDEELTKRLESMKDEFPAISEAIKNNGDFKRHPFNRLFVFNFA